MRFSRSSTASSLPQMQMMFMGTGTLPSLPLTTLPSLIEAPPTANKMVWGQPTWFLLHTLAAKVNDDSFPKIRTELLNLIWRICTNLPCPLCANHASEYLQRINLDAIQSKKDLKDMLFRFHNDVNLRKSYAQFQYSELDAKYENAITASVIQQFLTIFQQSHSNGAQINVNTFSTNRTQQFMNLWFRQNIHFFQP